MLATLPRKRPGKRSAINLIRLTRTAVSRRARTARRLEGPGIRRQAARIIQCKRHRDSHASLDRIRREAVRREAGPRCAHDHYGASLHSADLVHARPVRLGATTGAGCGPSLARPIRREVSHVYSDHRSGTRRLGRLSGKSRAKPRGDGKRQVPLFD
jgi:hypothetical protein